MVGGGGGRESDYSVCPRPLLQFLQFVQVLQFLQFRSVRLCQFTLEGRDVELDNCNQILRIFQDIFLSISYITKLNLATDN